MKNLFLALMGITMLSVSTDAQVIFVSENNGDGYNHGSYTIGTVNQNGNTTNFQAIRDSDGAMQNWLYRANENTITPFGPFAHVCIGGGTFVPTMGGPQWTIHLDAVALLTLGIQDCGINDTVECPEDLSPMLDACQASNAGLSAAVSAQGAQINELTSEADSLQALLDAANAQIDVLTADVNYYSTNLQACTDYSADLGQDYVDLQYDYNVLQGQAANCAQMYQDYQLFYIQETNALNAEIGDLEDEVALLSTDLMDCGDDVIDATAVIDSLQAELDAGCTFEQTIIDAALAVNAGLNEELDTLQALLNSANAELDGCEAGQDLLTAQVAELNADLVECNEDAAADIDYWVAAHEETVNEANAYIDSLNAIISAVPATIEEIVAPLNAALEEAEACCSSCPAAIETAVDNAVANANAECDDAIDDLLDQVQDNIDVITEELEFVNLLLTECQEGQVDGIIDMGGTMVTTVTGYYNALGQAINPADAHGIIIIRKHADGTFSKYFKQ